MAKFLNDSGLQYFYNKVKAKFQEKLTAGDNITISGNVISAQYPSAVMAFHATKSGSTITLTDSIKGADIKQAITTMGYNPIVVCDGGTSNDVVYETYLVKAITSINEVQLYRIDGSTLYSCSIAAGSSSGTVTTTTCLTTGDMIAITNSEIDAIVV